ncbi:MAG: Ig-like domain-containing protein [Gammaproteobacteria bacterium]
MLVNHKLNFALLFLLIFFISSCSSDSGSPANPGEDFSNISLLFIGIVKNDPLRIQKMPVGGNLQLIANGKNQNGDTVDISSVVTWSIDDTTIATISSSGLLETLKIGSTKVVVKRGNESVTATVTVLDMVLSIENNVTNFIVGDTQKLVAYVRSVDNILISINQSIIWKSSDSNIASIDTNGLMLLKNPGNVAITGNFYGVSNTLNIKVLGALAFKVDKTTINSSSLSWNAQATADFYRLKWITTGFGVISSQVISDTVNNIMTTHYVHQNLNADTFYEYQLEAVKLMNGSEKIINTSNTLVIDMPGNNSTILSGDVIGKGLDSNANLVKSVPIQLDSPNKFLKIDTAYINKQGANDFLVSDMIIKISNVSDNYTYCTQYLNGILVLDNKGVLVNQGNSTFGLMIAGKRFDKSIPVNVTCLGPRRSGYMYASKVLSDAEFDSASSLTATTIEGITPTGLGFPVSAVIPVSYSLVINGTTQQLNVIVKNTGTQAVKVTTYSQYILLDDQDNPLEYRSLKPVTGWTGDLAAGQSNTLVADMTYKGSANKVQVFVDY